MKVLYINTVCGRSSTGGIIRDIDAVLRINGHESLTLFGRYTAPDNINSICIDNKLDVYMHVLILDYLIGRALVLYAQQKER